MRCLKSPFAFATLAFLASGSSALAQSAGCAEINGYTSAVLPVPVEITLSSNPLNAGETVTISGSSFSSFFGGPGQGWYVSDPLSGNPGPFGSAPLSPIFTTPFVPFAETFTVPSGGMLSFGLAESGPIATVLENVVITCTFQSGGSQIVILSNNAQQRAINTALGRNYRARFAMAGVAQASGDQLFASTKGQGQDVSAWVSTSGRTYWDGYEGESVDLTLGLDSFVSQNTLVGVMLGFNSLSVTDLSGASTDADAAMFGVYAAHGYSNGLLTDAYLAWSRVSYDASGASFKTDRVMASIGVSGMIEQAGGTLQPRARLTGTWEDFPTGITGVVAGNTEQLLASVGAQFDWRDALTGTNLRPFISVDLEYGNAKDTSGNRDEFLAPRIGFGVNGSVEGGILSASVDFGRTTSDVYDAGLDLSYEVQF